MRTDLPAYCVYVDGELAEETTDVTSWWRDDLVGFLIGCSFTFEAALLEAGVPVRHVEQGVNVPMYRTTRRCRSAGAIGGPLVVSGVLGVRGDAAGGRRRVAAAAGDRARAGAHADHKCAGQRQPGVTRVAGCCLPALPSTYRPTGSSPSTMSASTTSTGVVTVSRC